MSCSTYSPNHDNSSKSLFPHLVTVSSCPGKLVQLMVIDVVFLLPKFMGTHKGLCIVLEETEEEFFPLEIPRGGPLIQVPCVPILESPVFPYLGNI